jgi:hypothetical protein
MLARTRESRKTARRSARRDAQIIVATRVMPIRCVLHDISNGGARLGFAERATNLPRTFALALYQGSVWRECQVVWTNGRFVGVKFVSKWCTEAAKSPRGKFNSVRDMHAERAP